MVINKCYKESFSVIGKKGTSEDGRGYIADLWKKANHDIRDVLPLAKRNKNGNLIGCWGIRNDKSMKFKEWDKEGFYLAGVEVENDAVAPYGWIKWTLPASNYVYIKVEGKTSEALAEAKKYIDEKGLEACGAYQEFMAPEETGQLYIFIPVNEKNVFFFPGQKK